MSHGSRRASKGTTYVEYIFAEQFHPSWFYFSDIYLSGWRAQREELDPGARRTMSTLFYSNQLVVSGLLVGDAGSNGSEIIIKKSAGGLNSSQQ